MVEDNSINLFDVRLTQDGVVAIKKFEKIAKWVMVIVIMMAALTIVESFANYFFTNEKYLVGNKLLLFQSRIYPYYAAAYSILAIIQTYFYLKTGRQLSSAIDKRDEAGFNHSFFHLYRNAFLAIITLLIGLLMDILQFFILAYSFYKK